MNELKNLTLEELLEPAEPNLPLPRIIQPGRALRDIGLPSYADEMSAKFKTGPFQLGACLFGIDAQQIWKPASPFGKRQYDLPRLVNIVASIPKKLVELMITGRLNEVHHDPKPENLFLIEDNKLDIESFGDHSRPVIYVMTHCTKRGVTPTGNEYLEALGIIQKYIEKPQNSDRWVMLDELAEEIDSILINERAWNGMCGMLYRDRWVKDSKGVRFLHPRRYMINEGQRQQIQQFITNLEKRLDKIPPEEMDKSTLWCLAYVGWTGRDDERKDEHYTHWGTATCVKFLIESVMAIKVTTPNRYFMWYVPLSPVMDPMDISVAEHAASLLCHSYTKFGGLNGTTGGGGDLIVKNRNKSKKVWNNGVEQAILQGVYVEAARGLEEEVSIRRAFKEETGEYSGQRNHQMTQGAMKEGLKDEKDIREGLEDAFETWKNGVKRWHKVADAKLGLELDILKLGELNLDFGGEDNEVSGV